MEGLPHLLLDRSEKKIDLALGLLILLEVLYEQSAAGVDADKARGEIKAS